MPCRAPGRKRDGGRPLAVLPFLRRGPQHHPLLPGAAASGLVGTIWRGHFSCYAVALARRAAPQYAGGIHDREPHCPGDQDAPATVARRRKLGSGRRSWGIQHKRRLSRIRSKLRIWLLS